MELPISIPINCNCLLPHDHLKNFMQENEISRTVFDVCDNHFFYMFGVVPKKFDFKISKTDFHFPYNSAQAGNSTFYRGPSLVALSPFKTLETCDNIVFEEKDVVFPFSDFAKDNFFTLNEACKKIVNSKTGNRFLSKPLDTFLGKIMYEQMFKKGEKSFNQVNEVSCYAANFNFDVTKLILNSYVTFLENFLFPAQTNSFEFSFKELEDENYLKIIKKRRYDTFNTLELYRSDIFKYFQSVKHIDNYSAQLLYFIAFLELPVSENNGVTVTNFCGIQPNLDFDSDKGFIATRNINENEELFLSNFGFLNLKSWYLLKVKTERLEFSCFAQYSRLPPKVTQKESYEPLTLKFDSIQNLKTRASKQISEFKENGEEGDSDIEMEGIQSTSSVSKASSSKTTIGTQYVTPEPKKSTKSTSEKRSSSPSLQTEEIREIREIREIQTKCQSVKCKEIAYSLLNLLKSNKETLLDCEKEYYKNIEEYNDLRKNANESNVQNKSFYTSIYEDKKYVDQLDQIFNGFGWTETDEIENQKKIQKSTDSDEDL